MVKTGSNAVAGSWKIIATRLPRRSASALPVMPRISSPSSLMLPDQRVRCSGCSFRIERRVTLLPEPDSPRMPSVSPRVTSKLTPFTACTVRSGVTKVTLRSLTWRSSAISGSPRMARAANAHVAGHRLRAAVGEQRLGPRADSLGERAARAEAAARRRIDGIGRITLDRRFLGPLARVHRRPRREQRLGVGMLWVAVNRIDGADLADLAEIHHQHAIAGVLPHV